MNIDRLIETKNILEIKYSLHCVIKRKIIISIVYKLYQGYQIAIQQVSKGN